MYGKYIFYHIIGQEYDEESELNYLNARYYDGSRGQFMSQDPVHLAVGSPKLSDILVRANGLPNSSFKSPGIERAKNQAILQQFLSDPQLQNSYGYARNNPVTYSDQSGEFIGPIAGAIIKGVFDLATLGLTGIAAYEAKTTIFDYPDQFTSQEKVVSGAKVVTFPGLRFIGSRFGTVQEKAAVDFLTNALEVTDIIQSAPGAVRDTYNSVRNYFSGGGNQTYTTPSGAVVDSGGNLISGPSKEDK